MNRLLPGLADDLWTIAFRAVEAVLREDPTLAEHVKTWRSRDGSPDDEQPPAYGELPMIALSPVPRPDEILDTGSAKVNFAVAVQVFAPGTCADDLLNLWGAVVRAVHPLRPHRGTTVKDWLSCRLPDAPPMAGSTVPVKASLFGLRASDPGYLPVDAGRPGPDGETASIQHGTGLLVSYFQRPA